MEWEKVGVYMLFDAKVPGFFGVRHRFTKKEQHFALDMVGDGSATLTALVIDKNYSERLANVKMATQAESAEGVVLYGKFPVQFTLMPAIADAVKALSPPKREEVPAVKEYDLSIEDDDEEDDIL
eukprot:5421121-Amphidinium_carterae.2